MRRSLAICLAALGIACAPAAPTASPPAASGSPSAVRAAPSSPTTRRLVVVVVLDQLGAWVLERYLPRLDPKGFLRRATREGSYFKRAVYPYATTFTAPGHAALFTGKAPADSGIVANEILDVRSGKTRAPIRDPRYPMFSATGEHLGSGRSPAQLLVPTVGDALKAQVPGAKVVTVSLKDRAAILPGGKRADLALWYDAGIGAFTSSTFYGPRLPDFVRGWLARHPVRDRMTPWTPLDAAFLAAHAGVDDGRGEGRYQGLGTTFPHDPTKATSPTKALRLFPQLTVYTTEVARALIEGFELGKDDEVDLLSVSISGLDYAGHCWGPSSWEYLDHLVRADAALSSWIDGVRALRGDVPVLIAADHGITPVPEKGGRGGRLGQAEVVALARKALGDASATVGFSRPYLYLAPALSAAARRKAVATLTRELPKHAGIRRVVDVRDAVALRASNVRLDRAIGLALRPDGPGDLYLVPEENWVIDTGWAKDGGTAHGAPWRADREVPVIVWGGGAKAQVVADDVSVLRVAPTIAALLGVEPPAGVTDAALPYD